METNPRTPVGYCSYSEIEDLTLLPLDLNAFDVIKYTVVSDNQLLHTIQPSLEWVQFVLSQQMKAFLT